MYRIVVVIAHRMFTFGPFESIDVAIEWAESRQNIKWHGYKVYVEGSEIHDNLNE